VPGKINLKAELHTGAGNRIPLQLDSEAGETVGEILRTLVDMNEVPAGTVLTRDGRTLSDQDRVTPGQVVQTVTPAGNKA